MAAGGVCSRFVAGCSDRKENFAMKTNTHASWLRRLGWFLPVLALMSVIGCSGGAGSGSQSQALSPDYVDAEALLNAIWEKMDEDSRPMIIGGVGETISETQPLALDLGDVETLTATLGVPAALVENAKSGASMMNGMMANHFTVSAWQLQQGAEAAALAEQAAQNLKEFHWICGTPEEYRILRQGDFILVSYGLGDQLKPFTEAASSILPDASVMEGTIAS